MPLIDAYYFGCWGQPGHYLYDVLHKNVERRVPDDFPCKVATLDGGFLPPRIPEQEGRVQLVHIGSWTIITFWDRTGDSRPASNSAFVLRNHHDFQAAIGLAKSLFPDVWARIKKPLTCGEQSAL